MRLRIAPSVLGMGLLCLTGSTAFAAMAVPASGVPDVDPNVALSALMQASDGHMQKMADSLSILAQNPEVQSGDWNKIRGPLSQVAKVNVDALNWFALPDGSYWSVQNGRESGNLSDRAYFPELMAGQTILGGLVVSKSTGKSVAVVAVPLFGANGKQIGALGASIYLDELSQRLRQELGFTDQMIWYSFDSTPLIGVNWNPAFILADPTQLGPDVTQAINEMLQTSEGAESYSYQGQSRTVIYRKSATSGWWYAFGTVQAAAAPGSG